MFAKAFRVRSNTAIKGSDRRKLRADVTAAFATLGTDQVSELIPGKEELNVVKLYTHKGDTVTVYTSGGNPILFELEKNLYPTVYTLWSYPDLLPTFTTWPLVLEKLVGGADLMLPGLMVPPAGLPQVQKGDLCAIALVGNRAPIAIGVAVLSTAEMLAAGLKGRGFSVLHTYQDHLWRSGDKSSPPSIAPPVQDAADVSEEKVQGDMRGLALQGEEGHREGSLPEASEDGSIQDPSPDPMDGRSLQEQMDDLLQQCFLQALKCRVKKADLPLLTSTFLGSHMFSCCPEGRQLDIKKSSYKKLSKFLQHMQQEEIVQVKELNRGVESIVAVDWKHPRKGSILEASEVRGSVINYAKKNDLVDANNKNLVKLDPILCDCILEKNEQQTVSKLPWDSLLSRCLEKLQPAYQVTFAGQQPVVKKGKICPIDISLAQRASNKKVTMVRNLEAYGLDPCSVANILQQRCQASTTVTPVPGSKDSLQVQIQGNQIHHLGQLLLEEYGLPRRHIQGLEKAPKPGKK
ncbi:eukaryotic translation initiation factor 2D isoform X3 [Cavia porcellus]|uniref:eukaryotic translation initiation factor 2D isoform X3 n=1 Tax=Cavia porcellus TaxID=10141 RepID=UPI000350C92D|nr:eukaryotic translation initiation factor 2D isoform X3 [Cavia porcellus]